MTREEFDKILFRTLVAIGDATYSSNDPAWDKEYDKMKRLPTKTFSDLCGVAVYMYNRSNQHLYN